MLFMPRRKAIEMKKQLRKEHAERLRKMNTELLKQYSDNEPKK